MANSVFYIVSSTQLPPRLSREEQTNPFAQREHEELVSLNSKSSSAMLSSRNAWLFQSNPILYDLRGALHTLNEQVWSVTRYAKDIRTGDRVYLWEAGRQGGIAAVAEISEPARVLPEPPEQLPFARVPETFAAERPRAKLRVLSIIEPVIPRESIISNPYLRTLSVLRCSRGTNFRLSLDQWHLLNGLVLRANGA